MDELRSVVVTARRFIAIDATTALALPPRRSWPSSRSCWCSPHGRTAGARQQAVAALVEGMGLDGATSGRRPPARPRPPDASEP
jgi:hypothetical protein